MKKAGKRAIIITGCILFFLAGFLFLQNIKMKKKIKELDVYEQVLIQEINELEEDKTTE